MDRYDRRSLYIPLSAAAQGREGVDERHWTCVVCVVGFVAVRAWIHGYFRIEHREIDLSFIVHWGLGGSLL